MEKGNDEMLREQADMELVELGLAEDDDRQQTEQEDVELSPLGDEPGEQHQERQPPSKSEGE